MEVWVSALKARLDGVVYRICAATIASLLLLSTPTFAQSFQIVVDLVIQKDASHTPDW